MGCFLAFPYFSFPEIYSIVRPGMCFIIVFCRIQHFGLDHQGEGRYMNIEEINRLKRITPEEQAILDGRQEVERGIYGKPDPFRFIVEHEKLLDPDKMITIRKHTRFIDFPPHTHNYVEFFYVVSGSVTHRVQGEKLTIYTGEMLLMNQYVQHEILACKESDLAVNFIIMPEFFKQVKQMVGEGNILADFMMNILQQKESAAQYLYFPAADDCCIQNLIDNIIFSMTHKQYNLGHIHQATIGLLFLYLVNMAEKVQVPSKDENANMLIMAVKQYIQEEYQTGTLGELAGRIGYSTSALSRLIKKYTGLNFKEMQARQRMEKAFGLLCQTAKPVSEIALEVGYENQNFFYKRFQQQFGMTPYEARKNGKYAVKQIRQRKGR
jgi:AraC family L-rhamnose operon regulatory protein RhaS